MISIFFFVLTAVQSYYGIVLLFNPDKAWEWHESRMRRQGIIPQRTNEWDDAQPMYGLVLMFAALVTLIIALNMWGK